MISMIRRSSMLILTLLAIAMVMMSIVVFAMMMVIPWMRELVVSSTTKISREKVSQ